MKKCYVITTYDDEILGVTLSRKTAVEIMLKYITYLRDCRGWFKPSPHPEDISFEEAFTEINQDLGIDECVWATEEDFYD